MPSISSGGILVRTLVFKVVWSTKQTSLGWCNCTIKCKVSLWSILMKALQQYLVVTVFFSPLNLSLTVLLIHSILSKISCLFKTFITALYLTYLSSNQVVECILLSQKFHQHYFLISMVLIDSRACHGEHLLECWDGPRSRTPAPFPTCR